MAVKVSDPVALGPSTLPSDSFSERRHCIFYADDGGLLSTNENNDRGEDLYYLGIIDILTPYNYVKKIEHYWKSLSQDKVKTLGHNFFFFDIVFFFFFWFIRFLTSFFFLFPACYLIRKSD